MTTYYHHRSLRHHHAGYIGFVEEYELRAFEYEYEDKNGELIREYGVYLPDGTRKTGFATPDEALRSADEYLRREGWVTDRSVAARRATREVELRKAGRLRFDGPHFNQAEFEACQREILEIH
jgi:hypothetical protein